MLGVWVCHFLCRPNYPPPPTPSTLRAHAACFCITCPAVHHLNNVLLRRERESTGSRERLPPNWCDLHARCSIVISRFVLVLLSLVCYPSPPLPSTSVTFPTLSGVVSCSVSLHLVKDRRVIHVQIYNLHLWPLLVECQPKSSYHFCI